jgi:hypothetical protein
MTTYSYCTAWLHMTEATQINFPDLLTVDMILLPDSSCLHMALVLLQLLGTLLLSSHTSDIRIFEQLKNENASDMMRR